MQSTRVRNTDKQHTFERQNSLLSRKNINFQIFFFLFCMIHWHHLKEKMQVQVSTCPFLINNSDTSHIVITRTKQETYIWNWRSVFILNFLPKCSSYLTLVQRLVRDLYGEINALHACVYIYIWQLSPHCGLLTWLLLLAITVSINFFTRKRTVIRCAEH